MNAMDRVFIMLLSWVALACVSCDGHRDFPDDSMKVGDVLCTDGDVMNPEAFGKSGKEAIAIVFHINNDNNTEGRGYAVYLWDLEQAAFADSTGVKQGTSADLSALDGNANTYTMYEGKNCGSPLAERVFALWKYGQSAYIPSVAQMRLLKASKTAVNPYIESCGGNRLPDEADLCWYWTSTEVRGQEESKAWLYSLQSGAIQETPKLHSYKARPVITINY